MKVAKAVSLMKAHVHNSALAGVSAGALLVVHASFTLRTGGCGMRAVDSNSVANPTAPDNTRITA